MIGVSSPIRSPLLEHEVSTYTSIIDTLLQLNSRSLVVTSSAVMPGDPCSITAVLFNFYIFWFITLDRTTFYLFDNIILVIFLKLSHAYSSNGAL